MSLNLYEQNDWGEGLYSYEAPVTENWEFAVYRREGLKERGEEYVREHMASGDWWTVPVWHNASYLLLGMLTNYMCWNSLRGTLHVAVPVRVGEATGGYVGFIKKADVPKATMSSWLAKLNLVANYEAACGGDGILFGQSASARGASETRIVAEAFLAEYGRKSLYFDKTLLPLAVPISATAIPYTTARVPVKRAEPKEVVSEEPHTNGVLKITLDEIQLDMLMKPVSKPLDKMWGYEKLLYRLKEGVSSSHQGVRTLTLSPADAALVIKYGAPRDKPPSGYQRKLALLFKDVKVAVGDGDTHRE